jgi:hypothetical protein
MGKEPHGMGIDASNAFGNQPMDCISSYGYVSFVSITAQRLPVV